MRFNHMLFEANTFAPYAIGREGDIEWLDSEEPVEVDLLDIIVVMPTTLSAEEILEWSKMDILAAAASSVSTSWSRWDLEGEPGSVHATVAFETSNIGNGSIQVRFPVTEFPDHAFHPAGWVAAHAGPLHALFAMRNLTLEEQSSGTINFLAYA